MEGGAWSATVYGVANSRTRLSDFTSQVALVVKNSPGNSGDVRDLERCKKAKWLSGKALQIPVKRREAKSKGEKERCKHPNAEFQRTAKEIRKPSSVINAKKQRKTREWERLEISSRKLEILRENLMQRWAP